MKKPVDVTKFICDNEMLAKYFLLYKVDHNFVIKIKEIKYKITGVQDELTTYGRPEDFEYSIIRSIFLTEHKERTF